MINALQIIVHIPLFGLNLPYNLLFFYQTILTIVQMDILPEQWTGSSTSILEYDEGKGPLNVYFEMMGYESTALI